MPRGVTNVTDRVFWPNIVVGGLAAGAIYRALRARYHPHLQVDSRPQLRQGAVGAIGAYVFYKSWSGARDAIHIKNLHFQLTWTHLSWNPTLPPCPFRWRCCSLWP